MNADVAELVDAALKSHCVSYLGETQWHVEGRWS